MVTDAEAIRAAIALLEQVSQGRTAEEAQKEANRWEGSGDLNEELLAGWALEAARILSLLKTAPPAPGVPGVPPGLALLTEERLEVLYREWLDSEAHLYEGDHYGHERAAFYAGAAAAYPVIAAAERDRLYTQLGNDHHVIFTEDGWTVEHSVECRLSGHMHECAYFTAVQEIADEYDPGNAGRWKITDIDDEGLPSLERAEAPSGQ
jgi:hypothetical protein